MKLNYSRKIYQLFALSVLLSTILFSCKGNSSNTFTIEGTIKNLQGNQVLLVRDYPDSVVVDTIGVSDGGFKFKGITDTLMIGTLYFNNGTSFTSLFVDKGSKVKIDGDANLPDLIEVKGGDENNSLTDFKNNSKSLLTTRAKLFETIYGKSSKSTFSKPSPAVISKISNLNYRLANNASEYIKKNPEKITSVLLIQNFLKENTSVDQLDKKIQALKEPASKFPLTYQLRRYITQAKASQEGEVAPYFSLKGTQGSETNLDEYRGRYLLLSFSSSDSLLHLKKEQEELSRINKYYKGTLVSILSVVLTNKKSNSKQLDNIKTGWKTIYPKEGWAAKILADYNVNSLPLSVLINPEGKILVREESLSLIPSKLPKLAATQ